MEARIWLDLAQLLQSSLALLLQLKRRKALWTLRWLAAASALLVLTQKSLGLQLLLVLLMEARIWLDLAQLLQSSLALLLQLKRRKALRTLRWLAAASALLELKQKSLGLQLLLVLLMEARICLDLVLLQPSSSLAQPPLQKLRKS